MCTWFFVAVQFCAFHGTGIPKRDHHIEYMKTNYSRSISEKHYFYWSFNASGSITTKPSLPKYYMVWWPGSDKICFLQEKHSACSDPGWWRGEARRHEWLVFKAVSKLLGGYSCRMFRCSTKKRIVWGYTWCSDATAEKWSTLDDLSRWRRSGWKRGFLPKEEGAQVTGSTGTQVTGSGFVWGKEGEWNERSRVSWSWLGSLTRGFRRQSTLQSNEKYIHQIVQKGNLQRIIKHGLLQNLEDLRYTGPNHDLILVTFVSHEKLPIFGDFHGFWMILASKPSRRTRWGNWKSSSLTWRTPLGAVGKSV